MEQLKKLAKNTDASKPLRHFILWAVLLFVIIAVIWAYFAKIDEITRAEGKVIPSRHVQLIQNLEGGIVKNILVREGEKVKKGQVLMVLDDTKFSAAYEELNSKMRALQIRKLRLMAEVNNKPFVVPDELKKKNPDLVQSEIAQYHSRQNESKSTKRNSSLTVRELIMARPVLELGAVSEVEVLRLEQRVSELRKAMLNEQSKALDELNKIKGELLNLIKKNLATKDQLDRTTVRSPVAGVIKQVYVNTIGGVVKPGDNLIEVVPLDDTLLVEGKVNPRDIGFIHVGQPALVKISAYDFSIYGGLKANVVHISADTTVDEKKDESYYEVWVRTDKSYIVRKGGTKRLNIIPGMQATIDIITGKKTILTYLMKPIIKAKNNALTER